MKPWPGMSRGTEWTVPIIPGLVIVAVVPAKSSGESLFVRTLRMSSSYAAKNDAKSSSSACLMFGTRSVREPSDFSWSIASPRFRCSWCTTAGLPSTTPYPEFMAGIFCTAFAIAYAMRCVKLTLPRPTRLRWLFRIWRLTSTSFAATVRTDVAVGTARLASMLSTTRAAAPRRGSGVSPSITSGAPAAGFAGGAAGVGVGAAGAAGAAAGTFTIGTGPVAGPARRGE